LFRDVREPKEVERLGSLATVALAGGERAILPAHDYIRAAVVASVQTRYDATVAAVAPAVPAAIVASAANSGPRGINW